MSCSSLQIASFGDTLVQKEAYAVYQIIFDFDPYLRHVHFRWASSLNRIASVEPPSTTTYIYSHAMVLFVALCLSDVGLAPTRQVPLQCAFIFFRRLLLYHCLQTRFYLQFGMEMELFWGTVEKIWKDIEKTKAKTTCYWNLLNQFSFDF